jgi:hypothetical protein
MLNTEKIKEIEEALKRDQVFLKCINEAISFSGKESGHSNASPIEDVITNVLIESCGAIKSEKSRELGDCYIDSNYINIKFGAEKFGQPNMCSMNRILTAFVEDSIIDSYYIIKVKLDSAGGYSVKVFDMLDYIDVLIWNSGTGQIMIKELDFYKLEGERQQLSVTEKKIKIIDLYKKGMVEHIELRKKQLDKRLAKLSKLGHNTGI